MEDNGYTAFHFNLTNFCVVETAYTETYNCTVVDVCATKSFKVSQTVINTEACIPTLAVFISLFASIGNKYNTSKPYGITKKSKQLTSCEKWVIG